ncbi:MAG: ribonuclease P protein component [Candidatus Paceibacterota bacterium]|jgi:ribonuclease P protein component
MLPEGNRLRKQKDFERVLKLGKGLRQKALFLKITKNGLSQSRFGFIVSKKTAKRAVERNKIKRHLRDIVRRDLGKIKTGYDAVFIAYPAIKELGFKEREALTRDIIGKIRLSENRLLVV